MSSEERAKQSKRDQYSPPRKEQSGCRHKSLTEIACQTDEARKRSTYPIQTVFFGTMF